MSIQKNGTTFVTDKGYVGQRPEVGIANKSMELMTKFISKFGLSPSDRTRMDVLAPVDIPGSRLASFLSDGGEDETVQ